ncbi:unnamed protein product, partial [Tetraodon nigroviridis]
EDADCVCSVGMKFAWDINDPKLPQVPINNRWTVTMIRISTREVIRRR